MGSSHRFRCVQIRMILAYADTHTHTHTHTLKMAVAPSPMDAENFPNPPCSYTCVHFLSVYFFSVYTRSTTWTWEALSFPIFGGGNAILLITSKPCPLCFARLPAFPKKNFLDGFFAPVSLRSNQNDSRICRHTHTHTHTH